ncbi:nitroreductase family protein [Rhizobium herbae]|uniref:Nitroreductase family protein n=1 Tax=Rhizobium herbae TaxID=508661 RepID=A0ABS7HBL1_9HYPH|nr:nitroreductase family protein [Rhizobium herbae]MBW9064657.1 nitroreductase family protein [Rhizobium herbae]
MRHVKISSLNQIAHASQFVDAEVESEIRTFHQHTISVAGTLLENSLSQPYLTLEDLKRAEAFETRFSHITGNIEGSLERTDPVIRWPSVSTGSPRQINFATVAQIFAQAIGADSSGRRPYPSGGALYSIETVAILGDSVGGATDFSVLHYLPVSNFFEVLPGAYDREKFQKIYKIEAAAFYVAYFINLKKAIFKYRSRGYRLALMEIGSMYQQMLQVAQTHGLGSRVLSGFSEYALAKNCGLDSRILLPGIIQAFAYPGEH